MNLDEIGEDKFLAGKADAIAFETMAGVVTATFLGELVRLGMSTPHSFAPGTDKKLIGFVS